MTAVIVLLVVFGLGGTLATDFNMTDALASTATTARGKDAQNHQEKGGRLGDGSPGKPDLASSNVI